MVGGTSILGGSGAIWRTFMGVLFIAIIGNGFTLLAWNPLYEQITLGVILRLAVGGDAWSRLRTTAPVPRIGSSPPVPTAKPSPCAIDPKRDLSATPSTPLGDVAGAGDRLPFMSLA